MNLLDKLERKIGWLAIPNLMLYILTGNVLVYVMQMFLGADLTAMLAFNRDAILAGQVWRIISFIFIPPAAFSGGMMSVLMAALIIFFYYSIGRQLEYAMGSFAFTMYYLIGMLGVIAVGCIFGGSISGVYLNTSLFFAYAVYFPDELILFMFFLPIKIKYLAYVSGALLVLQFVLTSVIGKILIITGVLNFLLFFGKSLFGRQMTHWSSRKRQHQRWKVIQGGKNPYQSAKESHSAAKHCCEICGRTEIDSPELEFRYCSACEGYHEYCMEHLHNHTHRKAGEA